MNALNSVTSRSVALPSFGESVSNALTAIKNAVVKVALVIWSYLKAGASWLQSAYAAHPQRFIVGGVAFAAGALIAAIWCSCRNRQTQPAPAPVPNPTVNVTTTTPGAAGTPATTTTSVSTNPPVLTSASTPQASRQQLYQIINGQFVPVQQG